VAGTIALVCTVVTTLIAIVEFRDRTRRRKELREGVAAVSGTDQVAARPLSRSGSVGPREWPPPLTPTRQRVSVGTSPRTAQPSSVLDRMVHGKDGVPSAEATVITRWILLANYSLPLLVGLMAIRYVIAVSSDEYSHDLFEYLTWVWLATDLAFLAAVVAALVTRSQWRRALTRSMRVSGAFIVLVAITAIVFNH
jgi:hypothetical protein